MNRARSGDPRRSTLARALARGARVGTRRRSRALFPRKSAVRLFSILTNTHLRHVGHVAAVRRRGRRGPARRPVVTHMKSNSVRVRALLGRASEAMRAGVGREPDQGNFSRKYLSTRRGSIRETTGNTFIGFLVIVIITSFKPSSFFFRTSGEFLESQTLRNPKSTQISRLVKKEDGWKPVTLANT